MLFGAAQSSIRLIDKFPIIILIGAGVLAWTAAKMIVKDAYTQEFFNSQTSIYIFEALIVITVILIGLLGKFFTQSKRIAQNR